jgi:MOSC domain-containing protein YiiM
MAEPDDDQLWSDRDLRTSLPIAGNLIAEYTDGLATDALDRLGPEGRSIRDAARAIADAIETIEPTGLAGDLRDPLPDEGRRQAVRAAHVLRTELHELGRARHALGSGTPSQRGSVTALHRSGGGVPKQDVDEVEVTWSGVVGDAQNDRRHHGRPFQALCLWSADVIQSLVDEGHPVFAGAAGENITVRGVDWATLRPGTIVQVGEVEAEISSYSTPCAKNAAWFAERNFRRMDQDLHPGWSRLYAWVRRPGIVRVGDVFEVEPN